MIIPINDQFKKSDTGSFQGGTMKKRGFTLIEILVTVLILGVLAAVALPSFTKVKTKAERDQVVSYLRTIRTSLKMYYGKWKTYVPLNNTSEIKTNLGVETQAANYTFAVTAPTSTTFTATAFRTSTGSLVLDQDGSWDASTDPRHPTT